jgi:hypothetical protein
VAGPLSPRRAYVLHRVASAICRLAPQCPCVRRAAQRGPKLRRVGPALTRRQPERRRPLSLCVQPSSSRHIAGAPCTRCARCYCDDNSSGCCVARSCRRGCVYLFATAHSGQRSTNAAAAPPVRRRASAVATHAFFLAVRAGRCLSRQRLTHASPPQLAPGAVLTSLQSLRPRITGDSCDAVARALTC